MVNPSCARGSDPHLVSAVLVETFQTLSSCWLLPTSKYHPISHSVLRSANELMMGIWYLLSCLSWSKLALSCRLNSGINLRPRVTMATRPTFMTGFEVSKRNLWLWLTVSRRTLCHFCSWWGRECGTEWLTLLSRTLLGCWENGSPLPWMVRGKSISPKRQDEHPDPD